MTQTAYDAITARHCGDHGSRPDFLAETMERHASTIGQRTRLQGVSTPSFLRSVPTRYPRWLTFNQAQELGGNVRRGEHGRIIVTLWKWLKPGAKEADQDFSDSALAGKAIPGCGITGCLTLSNARDSRSSNPWRPWRNSIRMRGLPAPVLLVAGMPFRPTIMHGKSGAFYSPSLDSVGMPNFETFRSAAGYYATMFHELGHSTGHTSRLNRTTVTQNARFGSETYSREELVAELTSAFLCQTIGLDNSTVENSAAYCQGWLSALKGDSKFIVVAAAQAQRAADYIRGVSPGDDQE